MPARHRFRLDRSAWWMWRDALLLSTGFPVSGLARLSAPDLATGVDEYLAGASDPAALTALFRRTMDRLAVELGRIARDDRLREALIWERSDELDALDDLATMPAGPLTGDRRERAERLLARWQRYCTANESIGFFGPTAWITVDPERPATAVTVGPQVLSRRQVFLEPWALAAYGAALAADPEVRRWLPPSPGPHRFVAASRLLRPGHPPVTLTGPEAAAIRLSDGRRPAARVASELVSTGVVGPDEEAAYRLLESLVERRLLDWNANLPVAPHTEEVLADRITAIEDPTVRQRVEGGLERLRSARDAVARAAGDPGPLSDALDDIDRTFTSLVDRPPRRRGWTYPGIGICYEDTIRGVDITVGGDLVRTITPALLICLEAARWATAELARRFEAVLARLVAAEAATSGPVTLSTVWNRAADLLLAKDGSDLYTGVLDEFERRWRSLLCLDDDAHHLTFRSDRIGEPARQLFAAAPGWSMARVHSPDILVCASSADELASQPIAAVLGELHIAHATCCRRFFTWPLPDPLRPFDLATADYGRARIIPLIPQTWSRVAGRVMQLDETPSDRYIGFAPAAGVATDRVIPTAAVSIESGTHLVGRLPDGSAIPLLEIFGGLLSMCAANALRDALRGRHTPRIAIDGLVVWRETWRPGPDEIDLLDAAHQIDLLQGYRAARQLVGRLGLPERCFVRLSTRRKPVFVDFTNPLSISALGRAVREGRPAGRAVTVSITEMIPDIGQAWLGDADDNRHFAEFRLQVTDTAP